MTALLCSLAHETYMGLTSIPSRKAVQSIDHIISNWNIIAIFFRESELLLKDKAEEYRLVDLDADGLVDAVDRGNTQRQIDHMHRCDELLLPTC